MFGEGNCVFVTLLTVVNSKLRVNSQPAEQYI